MGLEQLQRLPPVIEDRSPAPAKWDPGQNDASVEMLRWFQRLMPHEQLSFPLSERHATTVTAAAESLRPMLDSGDHISHRANACKDP